MTWPKNVVPKNTTEKRKTYTKEFKEKVINEYVNENVSISDIMKKYNIEYYSTVYL